MFNTLLLTFAFVLNITKAVYFQAEPDKWRCFQDTVITNYTLEMETIILDEAVLNHIVQANDDLQAKGYKPN